MMAEANLAPVLVEHPIRAADVTGLLVARIDHKVASTADPAIAADPLTAKPFPRQRGATIRRGSGRTGEPVRCGAVAEQRVGQLHGPRVPPQLELAALKQDLRRWGSARAVDQATGELQCEGRRDVRSLRAIRDPKSGYTSVMQNHQAGMLPGR